MRASRGSPWLHMSVLLLSYWFLPGRVWVWKRNTPKKKKNSRDTNKPIHHSSAYHPYFWPWNILYPVSTNFIIFHQLKQEKANWICWIQLFTNYFDQAFKLRIKGFTIWFSFKLHNFVSSWSDRDLDVWYQKLFQGCIYHINKAKF